MHEVELKFLNIDVNKIKDRLTEIGAKLIYDAYIESVSFKARGFSGSDSKQKYLRVRKINNEVEVTYKGVELDSLMSERREINLSVDDFQKTIEFFKELGFQPEKIFTKHRLHYELDGVHFELDTLKDIPTYLEIETSSQGDMEKACDLLQLDIKDGKKGMITEILPEKFGG